MASFENAAAVPTTGVAALQAHRYSGQRQTGESVVVDGTSGGVGTYAVQITKFLGATVTAVCSTGKTEIVRSIGADHVIDYTQEDFTESAKQSISSWTRQDPILDESVLLTLPSLSVTLVVAGTE